MASSSKNKALSDDELLSILKRERELSVGFESDEELHENREQALNYYKGVMTDVPALDGRSKVVSTDLADAIETVLPDLMEIFTAGEDVVSFNPTRQDDEAAAQQETDYVDYVTFQENAGFVTLYTMFKDALLEKTGIVMSTWETEEKVIEEVFKGKTLDTMQLAAQSGEIVDPKPSADGTTDPLTGQPLMDFTWRRTKNLGRVKLCAVAPDDFSVGRDTVMLKDATYAAMRSRPRVQDLIAIGLDRDDVDALPEYETPKDDAIERARDTAGESNAPKDDPNPDLRQVLVTTHVIKIDADGSGTPKRWMVLTGDEESVLLRKTEVSRTPFSAVTPFMTTHRFYGLSLADKLIEIMRIKTMLQRMVMDSAYFALNQRHEVADDGSNDFTIQDLLRPEPGVPIRSKSGQAVRPITSPGLSFDAVSTLEYFSTVAEQRTGVVRNAQGLNPNTLHDTASGAMALMTMAQKRVRMIARIFAETGIKDMYMAIHALVRENATEPAIVRLRGSWTTVDPTSWGERNDMAVDVGLGASGRDHDAMVMQQVMQMIEQIVVQQGGLSGPLVTASNAYNAVKRTLQKLGLKRPEDFVTDPSTLAPQPPKPDPKMVQAQQQQQLDVQKAAQQQQIDQQQAQADLALQKYKIDGQLQLQREQMQQEIQLKQTQMQLDARVRMAQALGAESAASQPHAANPNSGLPPGLGVPPVQFGGAPG